MKDLQLVVVNTLYDMFFIQDKVFHYFCGHIFLPVHTGVIIIVSFGGL